MAESARGLFRATGKKGKERYHDIEGEFVKTSKPPRKSGDFYPTPPEPTRALLKAEWARLHYRFIWEPAAGAGAMLNEFRRAGLRCCGSDIAIRCAGVQKSFFDFSTPLGDFIVTNPPYDAVNWRDGKGAWIEHALGNLDVEYMALLLSWNWPGAANLQSILCRWPLARVYLMTWKIDFTGEGAPPMLHGWFVWDKRHVGATTLGFLTRNMDPMQTDIEDAGDD